MKPISKTSAADLAAAALREEIASGQWDQRLPGARRLATRLGVSPPTVAAALLKLAGEGILEKPGERHAFRVAGARRRSSRSPAAPGVNRLLILTHEEHDRLVGGSRLLLEKLQSRMAGRGWKVDSQVVDFLHVKRPQRAWDQTILITPGTSVVALYGTPALAKWAVRRKVRILFLGGVAGEFPVPMVAVKSSLMAQVALDRLTALGHWRIVIPLCDRAEPFKESIREVTRHAVEAMGQTYHQNYHNPESPFLTPDVTWRILESCFSINPPTALVFLDWMELVTAQCYLMRMGLRVPENVSLVLLNGQMEAEWFFPKLFHFRYPARRILRVMMRWLDGGDDLPAHHQLHADLVEGGTLAPPDPASGHRP